MPAAGQYRRQPAITGVSAIADDQIVGLQAAHLLAGQQFLTHTAGSQASIQGHLIEQIVNQRCPAKGITLMCTAIIRTLLPAEDLSHRSGPGQAQHRAIHRQHPMTTPPLHQLLVFGSINAGQQHLLV